MQEKKDRKEEAEEVARVEAVSCPLAQVLGLACSSRDGH
jgi:hypothetical protein